jgi:hypothetical protein
MRRRGNSLLRSSIAILILLSLATVLVHWHEDKPGQDCGLCAAQQMPGLQAGTSTLLTLPVLHESRFVLQDQVQESVGELPLHSGRAPPTVLS